VKILLAVHAICYEYDDSLICFEEVFSCDSGPGHDTQFQAVSAAIFSRNKQGQDHFIHYKPMPEHGL
jgi:hypothetical protein